MAERKVLTEEERKSPYAKYYDLPMTPIPADKLALIDAPIDPKDALHIEDRNMIFDPGYLPSEEGWCLMEDGSGYVSAIFKMPGVTAEMYEWFMGWHALDDMRYRIWDPEDHFYARNQSPEKAMDASLPLRERTWGTTHFILEDVGGGADDLILNFRYPHELGYDEEKVGTDACAAMMCANGHGPVPGQGVAAIMLGAMRNIEGGVELRYRFWVGWGLMDGKLVKLVPDGISVPTEVLKGLYHHNIKEFSHLAAILPDLYAEFKDELPQ